LATLGGKRKGKKIQKKRRLTKWKKIGKEKGPKEKENSGTPIKEFPPGWKPIKFVCLPRSPAWTR